MDKIFKTEEAFLDSDESSIASEKKEEPEFEMEEEQEPDE